MSRMLVIVIVVAIGIVGFFLGRQRAVSKDDRSVKAHSLPHYHGWWVFLVSVLPAIIFIMVWAIGSGFYIERQAVNSLPVHNSESVIASQSLELGMVSGIARGLDKLTDQ